MIHLYACSISATSGYKTVSTAIGITAVSKNEAIGMAIEYARDVFPVGEYHGHQASVAKFSDESILKAASCLLKK